MIRQLLFLIFAVGALGAAQREVTVTNGTIIGTEVAVESDKAWQFLGIPFAEKPLGKLRFAKPLPIRTKWTQPLMAVKPPNRCPQIVSILSIDDKVSKELVSPYQEDCLYLNIWTPHSTKQPKAVMVWIHGGGYSIGEGLPWYNGAALAALEDVIVVTVHYRLGALGFLRLSNSVRGNWGMFDQQMAFRWVHENIAAFGGDPQSVTIFGESAGGSSVTLHALNSESARYFKRIIAQSGVAYALWAMSRQPDSMTEKHKHFVIAVGCESDNEQAALECLRSKNVEELMAKQKNITYYHWLPIVDGDFLTAEPKVLTKEKGIPNHDLLIGVTTDEGGMLTDLYLKIMKNMTEANPSLKSVSIEQMLVKVMTTYFPSYPEITSPLALSAVLPLLTSQVDPTNQVLNLLKMNKAYSDSFFVCPLNRLIDDYDKVNIPVFVYSFNHRNSFSPYPSYVGPTHMDEIPHLFRYDVIYSDLFKMNDEDKAMAKKISADWAHFAKTGRPASDGWKRFSSVKKEFYEYSMTSGPREGGLNRDDCAFWTSVLPQINNAGLAAQTAKTPEKAPETTYWRLMALIAVLLGMVIYLLTKQ